MFQPSAKFRTEYNALACAAGLVDLSDRTQIEFTGADRATFLHNLCTNAVRDLPAGRGCEAYVLNVKGHIVGHVFLFVAPDSIVLETVPEQAEKLIAHFDRYIIREDVQLGDRTQEWAEVFLSGPKAASILKNLGAAVPENRLDHNTTEIAGRGVWLRRVDLAGSDGFQIACRRNDLPAVQDRLSTDALPCGFEAFDALRIEAGTPLYGRDITEDNLPQEIDRDRFAISFTKGCYLGQETVARIDALGHVNRLLRQVKFAGETVPSIGAALQSADDGKSLGEISSSCWSPKVEAPLAVALVQRSASEPGFQFKTVVGAAEIVSTTL